MRRVLLALSLTAVACSSTALPSGGDGGNVDLASADLTQGPQPDFSGVDFAGLMCAATCQHCLGVCCGAGCCAPGEWCDSTSNTCHCGQGAACTNGEICATGGPSPGPGSNQCGIICCGGAGNPCPL